MGKLSKYFGLVALLFIVVMSFGLVTNNVNAKTAIDYFIIPNAYDDIESTCVFGDYIYILNDTKLQKISLETSLVVDEIDYPLLTSVSEFMRKGNRIFFDATIDAVRMIVAVDIETLTELGQVIRAELTPNFHKGLENVEYYDCNGDDFWVWAYGYCTASSRYFPNVFRGRYDAGSVDYEWTFISGCTLAEMGASGNFYVVHYRYNATSDTVDNTQWDTGATTPSRNHWYRASILFNHTSNAWESRTADRVVIQNAMPGSQADDNLMNLQYEYDEVWLDATWGEWGVRDNPNEDGGLTTGSGNNKPHVWLDASDRVLWFYDWLAGTQRRVYVARFDLDVGFIVWISGDLLNATTFWGTDTWGQMALARLEDNQFTMRTWIGYVNKTGIFPKAERFLGVGGTDCIASGTIEFNDYIPTKSMVFTARKNIIAIFRNGTDMDNLYVCRNLIDRGLLGTNGYITPTLSYHDALIYEADGVTLKNLALNPYLFMGEVYNLQADIANMTYFYLELDDGVNTIYFNYTNATKSLTIECNELVAGLVSGSVELVNATAQRYVLRWGFILNKNILDVPTGFNITYYGWNAWGENEVSGIAISGLRIYNLGGHVSYDMQGDGGRVTGGDWLEIYQTNGTGATTGAYAEIMYRRLQHVHVLWSLDVEDNACFDDDDNTGYVYMGIKYLDAFGDWVDGWYMRVRINKGAVDANDNAWITITTQWYAMDENGTTSLIGTGQYLSGYPECGDKVNAEITRTRFYTDLWFNTANSSTTVGGRLNTYYFGMDKTGFLLWTDWSPIMLNMSESMMFADLRDVNGDIVNPSEIELMKFWVRVLKISDGTCDAHTWSIRNPQISYQMADDRMRALNTPDGVETIIINMPSTGWMQPIAKAIESISSAIWAGALNFMKIMLGAVDSLLLFLNSPVSMSQMIQWIMLQASYITTWMVYVIEYVSSMLSIFSSMITVLTSIMTWAINVVMWVLVDVIGFPIAVLAFFVQILSGQEIVIFYGMIFDFSSVSGLITGVKEIAPFGVGFMYMSWLFWGNISMDGEIDEGGIISRIMQTFGWFRKVYNDLFWIFNRMRNEIISLYNFIRSHIPGLGGGGGGVEEGGIDG